MSPIPFRVLLALSFAILFFPSAARAQDPVSTYPENYKVLFENDRVRVIDFMLRKGATEESHTHPAHVVHVLTGFKIRFTFPDGTTKVRETKTGDVLFSEKVTHASKNVGDTDAHGLIVELKDAKAATPSTAAIAPDDALTAMTFITGIEGREEELLRELLALSAPTRAEAGCLRYDLYRSPVHANRFMRYEIWKDEGALEAHKKTPHIAASFEKRKTQGWTTEITLWNRVPDGPGVAAPQPRTD